MAEDTQTLTTDTPVDDAQPSTTPAAVNTPDSPPTSWDDIFKHPRFKELNDRAKNAEAELTKAQKEREKAEATALAEQGKFKELYETAATELETVRPYQERYETMIAQVKANNTKRIESLPEAQRTLVPDYDDDLKVQKWLDTNEAILMSKPQAPNLNGGSSNRTPSGEAAPSLSEVKEQATRMGVDWKLYAAQMGVSISE